ncbi:MAG: hypothetical protein M3041_16535 [Acidobacteriota bacterium]|nr:hypothetical protein [Acidobacteriota bacterium]
MASDDYFLEIEAHFALRRATPFILSGKDWALMQRWRDEGIPLPIVIEAIDSVFEKNEASGRRKVISSLSYCRHAVKELWDARRDLYVGGSDTTPEASPERRLEELANRLEEPFASRVRDLARERSVPRIEERLMEIERELIDTLIASQDVDALRREISTSLGDASKLDPKIRARTEEANLRRLVRERFNLPRLTLF